MDKWERRKGRSWGARAGRDKSAQQDYGIALGTLPRVRLRGGGGGKHDFMSKKLTGERGALGERSGSCVQTGSEEPEEARGK